MISATDNCINFDVKNLSVCNIRHSKYIIIEIKFKEVKIVNMITEVNIASDSSLFPVRLANAFSLKNAALKNLVFVTIWGGLPQALSTL